MERLDNEEDSKDFRDVRAKGGVEGGLDEDVFTATEGRASEFTGAEGRASEFTAAEEGASLHKCCTWSDIRERPEIVLWYVGNGLSYLGFYMPFINLAYYMQRKGIHAMHSSIALTLLSLAECVTYIVASFLGDYLKDRLVYVNVAASGALAVICIVWPLIDVNYEMILVISLAMGGFLGLNIVYTYAASGEVTGLPIEVAWSFTNLWSGIGILLGPVFSGVIFDIRKAYSDVFLVVGGVYVVDTLIFATIPLIQRRREAVAAASLDDLNPGRRFTTFRISTKRSVSRTSLAGISDVDGSSPSTTATTVGVGGRGSEYKTLSMDDLEEYSPVEPMSPANI